MTSRKSFSLPSWFFIYQRIHAGVGHMRRESCRKFLGTVFAVLPQHSLDAAVENLPRGVVILPRFSKGRYGRRSDDEKHDAPWTMLVVVDARLGESIHRTTSGQWALDWLNGQCKRGTSRAAGWTE